MASSVKLGERLEGVVDDLLATGRYGSRSEVLREGVRLVQEREARLVSLHAQIREGMADFARGDAEEAETVFDDLRNKYANQPEKAGA